MVDALSAKEVGLGGRMLLALAGGDGFATIQARSIWRRGRRYHPDLGRQP